MTDEQGQAEALRKATGAREVTHRVERRETDGTLTTETSATSSKGTDRVKVSINRAVQAAYEAGRAYEATRSGPCPGSSWSAELHAAEAHKEALKAVDDLAGS